MKKEIALIVMALAFLAGCGSGNQTSEIVPTTGTVAKKYLASNIVFKKSGAAALKADAVVDTTTQIQASDVILDNGSLGIDSQNVQNAFEQTAPKVSDSIVGTWDITLLNTGFVVGANNDFTIDGGTVTFNADGTFTAALLNPIGPFEGIYSRMTDPQINNISLKYQVIEDVMLSIKEEDDFTTQCTGNCPNFVSQVNHEGFMDSLPIYKSLLDKISVGNMILKRAN